MFIASTPDAPMTCRWVDAELCVENGVEVRRRIRAHDQHPPSGVAEKYRAGAGQRCLADAALAREEKVAGRSSQELRPMGSLVVVGHCVTELFCCPLNWS